MKRIKLYFTGWAAVMALFISSSALTSCNDDIADDDLYTYKAEMLSDWLRNNEDFSEFAGIVERAGKMDLFSTYGTYTCFAPTNAAVREYLQSRGLTSVDQLSVEDCDTLTCTAVLDRMYFTTELGDELAKAAEDNGDEEEEIKVQCVGAPRYRITVKSTDYLLAEKALKAAADRCIAVVEESDGNGSFLRELDNN
jgi:hypothetical protein